MQLGFCLPAPVALYCVVALTHPWPAIFSKSLNSRQLLFDSAQPTSSLQMSLAALPICDGFQLGPMCLEIVASLWGRGEFMFDMCHV